MQAAFRIGIGELGRARVVGADVDHRVRVSGRLVGVLLLDRAVPVAVVGGRRVVQVEVLDREIADLLAVERVLDLLDERVRLLRVRTLARQAGVDVDLVRARALLVLADCRLAAPAAAARCRRGRGSAGGATAGRERHSGRGEHPYLGELHESLLHNHGRRPPAIPGGAPRVLRGQPADSCARRLGLRRGLSGRWSTDERAA